MKKWMIGFCVVLFVSAYAAALQLEAQVETEPQPSADGVAIWVHPSDSSKSLVIGADPSRGLRVFDLQGALIQVVDFEVGGAGEVDVRNDFLLGDEKISLVAGGSKGGNTIYAYKVDSETGELEDVISGKIPTVCNAYGSCMYQSRESGKTYLFITSKEGRIVQFELVDDGNGKVAVNVVRDFLLDPPLKDNPVMEACVADDDLGWFYVAQENASRIWRFGAEPSDESEKVKVDDAGSSPDDNVEGLAICRDADGAGYLIASVQGSWIYKVYSRKPDDASAANHYLSSFAMAHNGVQVQAHDCIEISSANLGTNFPTGLFVTQDGNNENGPNFKLMRWDGEGVRP